MTSLLLSQHTKCIYIHCIYMYIPPCWGTSINHFSFGSSTLLYPHLAFHSWREHNHKNTNIQHDLGQLWLNFMQYQVHNFVYLCWIIKHHSRPLFLFDALFCTCYKITHTTASILRVSMSTFAWANFSQVVIGLGLGICREKLNSLFYQIFFGKQNFRLTS